MVIVSRISLVIYDLAQMRINDSQMAGGTRRLLQNWKLFRLETRWMIELN